MLSITPPGFRYTLTLSTFKKKVPDKYAPLFLGLSFETCLQMKVKRYHATILNVFQLETTFMLQFTALRAKINQEHQKKLVTFYKNSLEAMYVLYSM